MLKGEILTPEQLKCMKEHRDLITSSSLFDPYLQVIWCWMDRMTPRWLNCNVITVAGLIWNITGLVILMYYSPNAINEAPRWAYAVAAFTIFMYQACDMLDGKQCRRNLAKHQTQLADLFDHAFDAVSTVFIVIEFAICMRIGNRPDLFLPLMLTAMVMFFMAHWQKYITGLMRFSMFDVHEIQPVLSLMCLLTAILGPHVWVAQVFGIELREMVTVVTVILGVLKFVEHVLFIRGKGCTSTVAGTNVATPALHIGTVFFLVIVTKVTTDYYDYQPCIFLMVFGLIEAKMSYKFMLGNMTKSVVPFLDTILLGPMVLLANQLLMNPTPLQSHLLLWVVMIYCGADLIRYFTIVSLQICDLVQVTCFAPYNIEKQC